MSNLWTKYKLYFFMGVLFIVFAICLIPFLQASLQTEQQRIFIDMYLKVIGGSIVSVSATLGWITYRRNKQLERVKWLSQLHEKFFVEDTYQTARILLDYKYPSVDYKRLEIAFPDPGNFEVPQLQERLVIYLNFFEFVATLKKEGQLSLDEIRLVFGYYIASLKNHEWLYASLKKNKFRNLPTLIDEIIETETTVVDNGVASII